MGNRSFAVGTLGVFVAVAVGLVSCGGSALAPASKAIVTGSQHGSLNISGQKRTYRLFFPPSLDQHKPAALVVSLHPCPAPANPDDDYSHFDDQASAGGFISAYPYAPQCWNDGSGHGPRYDDVGFVSGLIDQVSKNFPVDPKRVFIAGISVGALMSYWLACQLSDRIAAIAAVSGTMPVDDCQPARPVSILAMNGTEDANFPYEGGGPMNGKPILTVIKAWATRNGCTGDPIQSQAGITKTKLWNQCKSGAVVRLDTVVGGHHTWFGSPFNPVPGEPNANTVVWDFFSKVGSS